MNKEMTHHDNIILAIKHGLAGLSVSSASLGVSLIDSINKGLQTISLLVGITVGVLTCISILIKIRERKPKK